ncbi:hypothetical protein B0H14DRAFT_2192681, partial [Mycena olivaceomarginata]
WPTWMKEGFALLWVFKGGREWEEAVVKWTELERAYGLVNSVRRTDNAAAKGWAARGHRQVVKGGRSTKPLEIVLDKHIKAWWSWWAGLAPSWREQDEHGRPVIGKQGPWEVLVRPGGNGMLTAMLCLGWWLAAEGKATEDWHTAVKDVKWVLEGLL